MLCALYVLRMFIWPSNLIILLIQLSKILSELYIPPERIEFVWRYFVWFMSLKWLTIFLFILMLKRPCSVAGQLLSHWEWKGCHGFAVEVSDAQAEGISLDTQVNAVQAWLPTSNSCLGKWRHSINRARWLARLIISASTGFNWKTLPHWIK